MFGLVWMGALTLATSTARAKQPVDQLIKKIDGQFRSSGRYIPAMDLYHEAFGRIATEDLRELSEISRDELIEGLHRVNEGLALNRGVAENLIKIHQMTDLCRGLRPIEPTITEQECSAVARDGVSGLPQNALDDLVLSFKEQTAVRADEYDHDLDELLHLGVREALNTDWYKFKMAAMQFEDGKHLTHRVVYNMMSRGTDKRGYYVVGGTSLAIDALDHFRFRESDIQFIKNHPQFENVSPAFFDYLRTWRFGRNPVTGKIENTGWIRAVPEGTVMFPNETIMEITSDPISATLIECLLSPLIDSVTTSATKVARIVGQAGGATVVEGGTRRSGHALLGAYGALIGMAVGTSNAFIAKLTKTLPYGSMEHAIFGLYPSEIRAMIAYNKRFPGSTFLIDENDIFDGWRSAVRVAGASMGGVRTDSELFGKNMGDTTSALRDLAVELGLDVKFLVSNRIDEFELAKYGPGESAHSSVLVGTQAQNPSDANGANIVYKLAQVTDLRTGIVRPIAKASVGKVGIPGETEVFRILLPRKPDSSARELEYRAVKDIIAVKGENIEFGTPLLVDARDHLGRRTMPRVPMFETSGRTRQQLAAFSDEVRDIHARRGVYPVELSPRMAAKQASVLRLKKQRAFRVGVQIGSFNPVTTAHVKIALRSRALYDFDRTLVVPAHDNPVHGKTYKYDAAERVKMLHEAYDVHGVLIDEREVKAETGARTLDTLEQILAEIKREHAVVDLHVVVGDDVFDDLIDTSEKGKWRLHQKELLDGRFSWVVMKRHGHGDLDIPAELLLADWEKLSPTMYENTRTGSVIELQDLRVGNTISSSEERRLAEGVDTIFHGVDLQRTFWEARAGHLSGTLAVPGSNAIYDHAVALTKLAKRSPRIKSLLTKDYHHEIELRDPKWNGEFHGETSFDPHGMAQRTDSAGHEILWGIKDLFPAEDRLDIPHHYEKKGTVPELDRLVEVPFDIDQFANKIVDPRVQLVIQKNGVKSYDFTQNKNAVALLKRLPAKTVYVYGVATDFCVKDAANAYLDRGYEVFVVTDAIAGIEPKKSATELRKLKKRGAKLITTAEVLVRFEAGCGPLLTETAAPLEAAI